MRTAALVLLLILSSSLSLAEGLYQPVTTNVEELSLEKKIGQILLIGVNGTELNKINRERIASLSPGGVIFFGRNIKNARQVSLFNYNIQKYAQSLNLPPLFIALDQEGGSVTRLRSWPPLPSAAAVGRAADLNLAWKLAFFTGQMLRTLGFNVNLAPVLDLSDPYQSSFIGTRSYGHHPETVSKIGSAVINGYSSSNVMTVAKHFPGHGAAIGDSHRSTPIIPASLASLKETHLMPFANLAKHRLLPGVMVAHISMPKLDRTNLPATFSPSLLQNVLRQDLSYSGLVFTDDIEMLGAKSLRTPEARAIAAFKAGADVIMVAWNPSSQRRAYRALLAAVRSGEISESRLNQSVQRILSAKAAFAMTAPQKAPSLSELEKFVSHRELYAVIDRVVEKNLFLSDSARTLGSLFGSSEILLMSDNEAFNKSLLGAAPSERVRIVNLSAKYTPSRLERIIKGHAQNLHILICATKARTLKILNALSADARQQAILLTSEAPYSVKSASEYKTVFYSYTRHPQLGRLFAQTMHSRVPATEEKKHGSKDHQRQSF